MAALTDPDVLWLVLLQTDFETNIIVRRVNWLWYDIATSKRFWRQKAKDILHSKADFDNTFLSSEQRYLQLATLDRKYFYKCSERYIERHKFVKYVIKTKRHDLLDYIINKGFNHWGCIVDNAVRFEYQPLIEQYLESNHEYAVIGALKSGNKDLIDKYQHLILNFQPHWAGVGGVLRFVIKHGKDFLTHVLKLIPLDTLDNYHKQNLLRYALERNQRDIFDFIFPLVTINESFWGYLIWSAIQGCAFSGSLDLYQYIWSQAPPNRNYGPRWNGIISGTIQIKNHDLTKYFLNLVPSDFYPKLNWGGFFRAAISSSDLNFLKHLHKITPKIADFENSIIISSALILGNIEIIDYIFSITRNHDWDLIIKFSLYRGLSKVFEHILPLIPSNHVWNYNDLANDAISHENQAIFDYIRNKSPNYQWNWSKLAYSAVLRGNKQLFDHIRKFVPPTYAWDWNLIINIAIANSGKLLFDHIYQLNPNYSWGWTSIILSSFRRKDKSLFLHIRSLAPSDYEWNVNYLIEHAPKEWNITNHLQRLKIE